MKINNYTKRCSRNKITFFYFGHCRKFGALRVRNLTSLLEVSRGLESLCRTENSDRLSRQRLLVPLGYSDEFLFRGPDGWVPLPGSAFPLALDGRVATLPHRHRISPGA